MKKILILLLICIILMVILVKGIFSVYRNEKKTVEKDENSEIKEEPQKEDNKEETVIVVGAPEDNTEDVDYSELEGVFKMLDFDRRLVLSVGEQDESVCSIFTLAYARAILDSNYSADPYAYFDGDGAVWRLADYGDIASSDPLLKVLQRAYDEINEGRPTIFYVSGDYAYTTGTVPVVRTSGEHFVLIIGYKANADYNNLKPSDFYAADPSGGYRNNSDAHMPWVVLTDDAPELMLGEYALFAETDQSKHVSTCLAYPDQTMWDTDLSKEIHPVYYEQKSE